MYSIPKPGSVVVAQVLDHVGRTSVAVWLLDHDCRYQAYCHTVKDAAIGDIVFCRLSRDGTYMEKLLKAGTPTQEAYADKAFKISPEDLAEA